MRHEYFDSHPLSGKFYICHYGGAGERRESVLLRRTLFRSINVIRIFASAFGLFHTIVYHSPPYYVPLTVILAWSCEYILCSCGCHEPAAFNSWGFVVYRGKRVFRVANQTTCKGSGDTLKCSSIYSGTGRSGERNFFEWYTRCEFNCFLLFIGLFGGKSESTSTTPMGFCESSRTSCCLPHHPSLGSFRVATVSSCHLVRNYVIRIRDARMVCTIFCVAFGMAFSNRIIFVFFLRSCDVSRRIAVCHWRHKCA